MGHSTFIYFIYFFFSLNVHYVKTYDQAFDRTLFHLLFANYHPLLSPKHSLWAVSLVLHKCNLLPFYRHNCDYIKDGISEPLFLSIDAQRGFFILEIQLLPFRLRHGLYPCCLITHSVCFRGLSARAECQIKRYRLDNKYCKAWVTNPKSVQKDVDNKEFCVRKIQTAFR